MEMWREPATPCAAGRNALRGGRLTPLLCSSSEPLTEHPHLVQFLARFTRPLADPLNVTAQLLGLRRCAAPRERHSCRPDGGCMETPWTGLGYGHEFGTGSTSSPRSTTRISSP